MSLLHYTSPTMKKKKFISWENRNIVESWKWKWKYYIVQTVQGFFLIEINWMMVPKQSSWSLSIEYKSRNQSTQLQVVRKVMTNHWKSAQEHWRLYSRKILIFEIKDPHQQVFRFQKENCLHTKARNLQSSTQ